jgi:hypothetical protein
VVLLLFNQSTEWRYPEILEQTRMGKHLLVARLHRTVMC